MVPAFEVSAMQVAGFAKALGTLGLAEQVRARVAPSTLAALNQPYGARWHPGQVVVDVSDAIVAVGGPSALEAVTYEMTKQSFGPVVRPLLSVMLALTGNSPASLFSRLHQTVGVAMRGVEVDWAATGERGGTLSLTYPITLPPESLNTWRGVVRFLFELAKCETGSVARHELINGGRTLRMWVEW
jgi:hypothetical protein